MWRVSAPSPAVPEERSGLPADVETRVRNSSRHSGSGSVVAVNDNDAGAARRMGMLVVKSVVPGGPAMQGKLLPGDVLVSLDGELVTYFPDLEAMLDDIESGRYPSQYQCGKI